MTSPQPPEPDTSTVSGEREHFHAPKGARTRARPAQLPRRQAMADSARRTAADLERLVRTLRASPHVVPRVVTLERVDALAAHAAELRAHADRLAAPKPPRTSGTGKGSRSRRKSRGYPSGPAGLAAMAADAERDRTTLEAIVPPEVLARLDAARHAREEAARRACIAPHVSPDGYTTVVMPRVDLP